MQKWALRSTIVLVTWGAYVLLVFVFQPRSGEGITDLALVAVAISAWCGGLVVGVVVGLLSLPFNHLLLALASPEAFAVGFAASPESVRSMTFGVAAGGLAGYLKELRAQVSIYKQASQRAEHDALTGLLNRATFEARASDLLNESQEYGGLLALLLVDLDRFKFVNDTFGHEVGDELLKHVARVLKGNVRQNDLVARIGGDEFVLALRGLDKPQAAASIAAKLIRQLSSPVSIQGKMVSVGASIGISMAPADGGDLKALMKSADSAMYQIKASGKNWYAFSTHEMRDSESRRLRIERHLRWALENGELDLFYQPIVDLQSDSVVALEGLVRWNNAQLGAISPKEFIPLAEEVGLILPINRWVLREVCFQNAAWRRAGFPPVSVAVNVSTQYFVQPSFVREVSKILHDNGLPPEALELEITESVLVRDPDCAIRTLRELQRIGVQTSLDDFGTGYSSLAYLQQLPISKLKLDQSFVNGLTGSAVTASGSSALIAEAICSLAHKLQKPVIAEGVETRLQQRFLQKIDCDFGQGFLFAKPMRREDIERLFRKVGYRDVSPDAKQSVPAQHVRA